MGEERRVTGGETVGSPGLFATLRKRLGIAAASPWVRAPVLLLRYPGLLLAIGTAGAILAMAGASSPLFLSSAGNAALHQGLDATCPWTAGVSLTASGPLAGKDLPFFPNGFMPSSAIDAFRHADGDVRRVARTIPHMGPVQLQIVGSAVQASAPRGAKASSVRLYTRDGALANVQKLEGSTGSGIWLPNTTASALQLGAGDSVHLAGPDQAVDVRVAGVYRDLATLPRNRFWCGQDHLIYPLSAFANYLPPPLVLADRETFLDLSHRLREGGALFTWELPLAADGLTLTGGHAMVGGINQLTDPLREAVFGFNPKMQTSSTFLVDQADATVDALRSPVWTISLAGRLVALLVIAGSGVYWVHRRRTEAALLAARGVGPVATAGKALLETIPVAIVASVAGWAAGIWLVRTLGPSDLFDPGSTGAAFRQVAWTTALGVLFMAVVVGFTARRETEPGDARGRRSLAGAPWDVAVLLLAAASLYEILNRQTSAVGGLGSSSPQKVDVLVLLFPILFVAGAAGLAARLLRRVLPGLRTTGRSWSPAAYLAARRLAGAPRIVLALLTATAIAIGILSYAGALTSSVSATSDAKARVFTGSDLAVTLAEDVKIPPSIASRSTKVTEVDRAFTVSDQTSVEVLGVDRATFARAAFWDPSFADQPLAQLLRAIAPPSSPSVPLPVIAAGTPLGKSSDTLTFQFGAARVPVTIVDQIRAFPSMSPSEPLIVADRAALAARGVQGVVGVWVKGDPAPALRAFTGIDAHIITSVTAKEVQGQQSFVSLSYTFGFLEALGIMVGLIVLGGILLYLEARQRGRAISYALASRMGLSRRSHRASVALELGALLALGCVLGIALAWIAARVVYGRLDPMPQLPPAPLFRLPIAAFALTGLAVVIASLIGAWRVQRAAERVRVSEVMRLAG